MDSSSSKNNNSSDRKSQFVYQSLSFQMIDELVHSTQTPAWIRLWLYFSILQRKYNRVIYAKNKYLSEKLNIPFGTVKNAITKLRDDGLIEIINSGSWMRQIRLTHIANIKEDENGEIKKNNEAYYHSLYGRRQYTDHVYLSEDEYNALLEKVQDANELDTYINGLEKYLSNAVIKYSSHFKLIFIWIDRNELQIKNKKKKYDVPDYKWFFTVEREYIEKQNTQKKELYDYDWLNDTDFYSDEE